MWLAWVFESTPLALPRERFSHALCHPEEGCQPFPLQVEPRAPEDPSVTGPGACCRRGRPAEPSAEGTGRGWDCGIIKPRGNRPIVTTCLYIPAHWPSRGQRSLTRAHIWEDVSSQPQCPPQPCLVDLLGYLLLTRNTRERSSVLMRALVIRQV